MAKHPPAMGDFRPGSILRITLKNFMTHENVVIEPGPRVNMVLGANGTGKSTILNAICLGLGGSPKVLGRADDLRAFIMHGKDVAKIEIELATEDGRKLSILRSIDRRKGSEKGKGKGASTFYINDEKVKVDKVQELVQGTFNIQIDNLCTFLPQEKVGSFSGLSDADRLLETEKSISLLLHECHLELIQMEDSVQTDASNLDTLKNNLQRKEAELQRLDVDRGRQEARIKAEEALEMLEKKKLWLVFEELREVAIKYKEQKAAAKQELIDAMKQIEPLQGALDEIKAKRHKLDAFHQKLDQEIQDSKKEMNKQNSKFDNHDDQMERGFLKVADIETNRDKQERELEQAVTKLKELETKAVEMNLGDAQEKFEHAKNQARSTKKELDSAKREYRAVESETSDAEEAAKNLQRKLARLSDDTARRREKIFSTNNNLKKVYDWVQENRGRFRRSVFGPIAAEITATKFANCLEFHVPNSVLFSFVCELREDQDLLYKCIRSDMDIPVNILCVQNVALETTRVYSEQQMKEFKSRHGVEGYLDEAFTCAEPVMIALQKFARVHKVLVGGDQSQDSIDKHGLRDLISKKGDGQPFSSCIFTTTGDRTYRYTQTISEYSGNLSSREDQCGAPRMLAPGVDPKQKELVQDELNRAHAVLDEQRPKVAAIRKRLTDLESAAKENHHAAEGAKRDYDDVRKYESKIERQRARVKEIEEELKEDNDDERKELVTTLLKRWESCISCVENHGLRHEKMLESTTRNAGVVVQMSVLQMKETKAKDDLEDKSAAKFEAKQKALSADQRFKAAKVELGKQKERADAEAPIKDANGDPLPLQQVLDDLAVETLGEANDAIEETKAKMAEHEANPEVIRKYEKLKDEVALLQTEVDQSSSVREKQASKIEGKCDTFLQQLEGKIADVSTRFSKYMGEMGCTGSLRLRKGGEEGTDKRSFKKWGLEILVSFREGSKAQVLSAQRHSGGERSVSTIMFLMALQDLMTAPFRAVDEINQGLDDRNERLVFRRIVKNSTAPPGQNSTDHSGQYFLITPKLLPNLTDMENEAMTILFVFNGPHMFQSPSRWKEFLENKAAASKPTASDDIENQANGLGAPCHSKK